MRPLERWSYAPARREPGSRQPEQYALELGVIQISGHGKSPPSLLQSKVGPHRSSDHYLSDVEAPRQPGWRDPLVLGRRDGQGAVFRLDRGEKGPSCECLALSQPSIAV
jgi:hypothetical protein